MVSLRTLTTKVVVLSHSLWADVGKRPSDIRLLLGVTGTAEPRYLGVVGWIPDDDL